MRTAIAATVFVAGALAVPAHRHQHKRAEEVVVDYVTVTDIVTVTAGSEPTTTPVAVNNSPASSSSSSHKSWHHWWTWSSTLATSTKAASSAAPTTAVTTVTTQAPAPSSYQAPSSSPEPATTAEPTTTEAPATTAPASTWATSSSKAPATTASSASGGVVSTYPDIVVKHHNIHRSNHSAPDLTWSDSLAATAQKIADSCVYAHNVDMDGGGYGQNIAAGVDANNISAIITDLFYNGEVGWFDDLYGKDQPDMTNFEHWGHFSQIVWKGTTSVGCATQVCGKLQNVGNDVSPVFTVCNYDPPGNYANEYATNIGTPKKQATAEWDEDVASSYYD